MTQAGWFPDPQGASGLRYWDGAGWTDHTAPAAPVAAPELSPARRRNLARLCERCQPLVAPGETVHWVWTGRKGLGSSRLVLLLWVTQILLFLQKFYVIAVTERQIYVFKAGWFVRDKPTSLAFTLPRDTPLDSVLTGRMQLGKEKLRVERYHMPVIAAAAAGTPFPPA